MNSSRGTALRTQNRFETTSLERIDDGWDNLDLEDLPVVETEFLVDQTKSILSKNDSPDVGFTYSVNAYRGCEHGCAYCYARPSHEYLGYNAGIDFETKIIVKHNAAELLRKEFDKKSWQPQFVLMSGNTDCYQPCERKFGITRQMLEVFLDYRNPVGIITKNALALRDADLFSELAKLNLVSVTLSITTLDRTLARKLEPRTATPDRRLQVIRTLSGLGVPCGVMIGPVIPGLNDDEIPAILTAASDAGAISAGFNMVRLPFSVKPIFMDWLDRNVPLEADKVKKRLEMVRAGKLSDPNFGTRMRGTGAYAEYVETFFETTCRKLGLNQRDRTLSTEHFRRTGNLTLFD